MLGRSPSLPARRTRLLGRDATIRLLVERLGGEDARLVTVTGTGGAGKTTLALEAARQVEPSFPEGAAFVDLGSIEAGERVALAVVDALGLADAAATPADDLVAFLRAREMLLVLDSCEQVADATAALVDRLLDRCPALTVLVTSRTPLRVRGEHVVAIPPLPVPPRDAASITPAALLEVPSVALLVERVGAVDPTFRLDERTAPAAAAICARLDGLPLAIELAAAQAGALAVADVARRLETDAGFLGLASQTDAGRQRTLEATFDWSYRLLDRDEQALLRRLAAFDGGWTLEAAEEICAGGLTRTSALLGAMLGDDTVLDAARTVAAGRADELLESSGFVTEAAGAVTAQPPPTPLAPLGAPVASLLARLVDHSLVVRDGGTGEVRYRLLRPIAEIARARLAASGELPSVMAIHAAYYLALARERRPDSTYAATSDLDRIDADEANCVRALATLRGAGVVAASLAMVAALLEHWRVRGHLRTGREMLHAAILSADPASLPPQVLPVRAFALYAAADYSTLLGDLDAADASIDQGEVVFAAMGFAIGLATGYALRGNIAAGRGDLDGCRAWYDRAWTAMGEDAPDVTRMFWFASLGGQELSFAQWDDAWAHLEQARAIADRIPETWYHGRILGHLGIAARARGDREAARPLLVDGLRRLAAYGARVEAIPVLEALAGLAMDGGDAPGAATIFGAASVLREFTGVGDTPAAGTTSRRDLRRVRAALRLPVLGAAWARGRTMRLEDVLRLAEAAPEEVQATVRGTPGSELTSRERDVAVLVAKGMTNSEIARELGISVGTARIHVERILRKLGLASRVQVATWVVDGGLDPAA